MPCGCFGGSKSPKEKASGSLGGELLLSGPQNCCKTGYKGLVDSANAHTPSTVPLAIAAMPSSTDTALSHSSSRGATCRAELAQKRREFFRDFIPEDYRSSPFTLSSTLPATLPTAARAQKFGKVRIPHSLLRPASAHAPPPPPPGPHLLHPVPTSSRVPPKIESVDVGFASPEFLQELRSASDEISRRWTMSEEEREATPCNLKTKSPKYSFERTDQEEQQEFRRVERPNEMHSHSFSESFPRHVEECFSEYPAEVPQTLITPPSPPGSWEVTAVRSTSVDSRDANVNNKSGGDIQNKIFGNDFEENDVDIVVLASHSEGIDVNSSLSEELLNLEFTKYEQGQNLSNPKVYNLKEESESPEQESVHELDSPSELESLSTATTTTTADRYKLDPSESLHLHDDGLGSEIDEGSDIIDELHHPHQSTPKFTTTAEDHNGS